MPKLGVIKSNLYSHKFVWTSCEGCGKQRWVRLLRGKPEDSICINCANRIRTTGRIGSLNPYWRGGERHSLGYTYIYSPEHPQANINKLVARHRLVLEEKLGRQIPSTMVVHHINEIRGDDRPENLMELSRNQHNKLHKKNKKTTK